MCCEAVLFRQKQIGDDTNEQTTTANFICACSMYSSTSGISNPCDGYVKDWLVWQVAIVRDGEFPPVVVAAETCTLCSGCLSMHYGMSN